MMRVTKGQTRESILQDFVHWTSKHITGDEKGEAQIFLDRLFQAFGQKGSLDVGGTPELRVRKAKEDGGGTSFADYVWKPVVLIEMKKRGVDLAKHFRQAFDYWVRLVPDRPRYVVLCNFDEFWVYDFNTQLDSPKDKVKLSELSSRWGPLAFLFPTNEEPKFGNDREVVTRQAADRLAECFRKLIARKVDRGLAQRFILQSLVSLFAEDIGLLPRYLFSGLLADCRKPADSYDLLGGLFEAMNAKDTPAGGRYKGVRYFNGGIFADPARLELHPDEVAQLVGASQSDWSKVSPEIFGAIFQDSMDAEERHAFGAHYTSPVDIMKIVKPTISDPWSEAIEGAKSAKKLNDLLERLTTLRVLDPACGSGNFLYLAYREMKRLETRIRERLRDEFPKDQPRLIHVNARQFYGMDINSFAVELAKVTLMLGRKLAIEELHIGDEKDLPLDNLDKNFVAGDALMATGDNGAKPLKTPWPKADIIIGNPPFLGAKNLKPERGPDYVNALRKLYDDVPGMADYCVYWFRKAHDHLPDCTKSDPFSGRAGLVGTQNIRNNQSRVGGLDYVVATGTVFEAVDSQPWSGDANVNVSIVNWVKSRDVAVVPTIRRIWSKAAAPPAKGRKGGSSSKVYELVNREVKAISSALSDGEDVSDAAVLGCNTEPKKVFQGVTPGHAGFVLEPSEMAEIVRRDPKSKDVIFPYLIGQELVTGEGRPERFIIDFQPRSVIEAQAFSAAFARVKNTVLPDRRAKAEAGKDAAGKMRSHHRQFLERWWRLSWERADMHKALQALPGKRCVVCSRVTKRPIFVFTDAAMRLGDRLQVFAFDDDYSFGVLQSATHWLWFATKCSKLTERLIYTPDTVFDTFPWPQSPTKKQIDAVAAAAVEVRRVRAEALKMIDGGLRGLYRTLELPGRNPLRDAHEALDAAVLGAYGFSGKKDLLAQLLELNQRVAAAEKAGERVTAPGVPASYGDAGKLVTEDCIRP